ncbi:MAG: ribosome maturation factor RimP [Actinomycetaceae bacterium]|nr:ribosome maturation factor RimP [Arcanobacterium sp.]MDD7504521.1 ribosome maturation factor RimP [Actinomycetaceae bacterium]MDY6142810.1 ribosome maturation factor RimP [Arcanobacterium sp.]
MSDYNRTNTQQLTRILEPHVKAAGLYLDDVRLTRAGKHSVLLITVDLEYGPGGVDSADLESVTRAISAVLDAEDPIPGAYTLEVSTPGAERNVSTEREFSRVIGHLVQFTLNTGEQFLARVEKVTTNELKVWTVVKSGKRDVPGVHRTIEMTTISKARSVVELTKVDFESEEDA